MEICFAWIEGDEASDLLEKVIQSGKKFTSFIAGSTAIRNQVSFYYNLDVVAILDQIIIQRQGLNRVYVSNINSGNLPPTTKIGITTHGGFQGELHYFLFRHLLDKSQFHILKFYLNGSCSSDPQSKLGHRRLNAFLRSPAAKPRRSLENFLAHAVTLSCRATPGAVDARQAVPKPYYEYCVSIFPQDQLHHICHLPWQDTSIMISGPSDTVPFRHEQPLYETVTTFDLAVFVPTTCAPLGYVVHARSGDKGSDANVGLFFPVRYAGEWDWLRSMLTVDKVRSLLGKDAMGNRISRFELPNLSDDLDRGVTSSSTYDVLGKNVAEHLHCKYVYIPNRFLGRGRI
ncbi:hypothetical protein ASPFODRAFT_85933 [Aspergillus luchuensis CBS 106.47]|uniref:Uncharacterized protein n=1 Tax=Aspergillus luchuensis (strain CBS 106.47) TaxID=1137211 RepID=A0A1M3T0V4_ASPLC|nr:hypothetical protein ASPFODRAFT_85933 [Aspergillus luchuensis CBS 106.47]